MIGNKPKITHETKNIRRTEEEVRILKEFAYKVNKMAPIGAQLSGIAVVSIFEAPNSLFYLSMSEVGHINEKVVDGAIKDLAKHCMRQFGRKAPKLIGEKDAEETN